MQNKELFKNAITAALVIGLFILAIMIVRPVAMSILFGILLAYIFYPLYKFLVSKIKNENLSAIIICAGLIIIILSVLILIFNSLASQAIDLYFSLQDANLEGTINEILPKFLSKELSENLAGSLDSFISNSLADFISGFTSFILNLPVIMLQLFIVVFVFFFSLRDGKKGVEYVKSLSHLGKETQEKFFKQFKDITNSVLLGQVIIGIVQGLIAGIGYFIFGVPNALILTIATMFVGIIPLIGPWLVWLPVDIYLFAVGRTGAGLGLLIYGLIIISWIDVFLRPLIVSRKTEINSAIVIIGMLGGLFVFGVLGLIIGPLVLAYVLLVIELYRKKNLSRDDIIFKKVEPKNKTKNLKDFFS
jgi:predicted PurR-regulated permease PerM